MKTKPTQPAPKPGETPNETTVRILNGPHPGVLADPAAVVRTLDKLDLNPS